MVRHIKTIIITVFSLLPFMALADYSAKCEGYNSETSVAVEGICTNGKFSGTDSHTGSEVRGDCEIGGSFEAYDTTTNAYVAGECEGKDEGNSEDEGNGDDGNEGYDENESD